MVLRRPVFAGVLLANATNLRRALENDLTQDMTHELKMNFNKIASLGTEDTAKELTQKTFVVRWKMISLRK